MNRIFKIRNYMSFVMAVILISNIFLFLPFIVYFGNINEFLVPVPELIKLLSIPALTCLLLLSVIASLLKGKLRHYYGSFLAVTSILIWIQGTILVWEYGILDGRGIDWSKDAWRGWVDVSVWFIIIATTIKYHNKLNKFIAQAALAIFFTQFIFLIYSVMENVDNIKEKSNLTLDDDAKELYKFSTEKNVLHLVLDGFQADVFKELVNDKELGQIYRSNMNGFVYYEETLGTFPYTRFAVPAFLSGKIYNNSVIKDDFIASVLEGKTILNAASDAGYELDLASEGYFGKMYAKSRYKNSYILSAKDSGDLIIENVAKILDLTLFRIFPHFFKTYIYNNQSWYLSAKLSDDESLQYWYFSHTLFLNNFIYNIVAERKVPVYKYIHVMLTHNPMVVKPDCSYAGGVFETTRLTLTIQSKCSLDTVVRLLKKMKELGVYDNSLIIIHADHGGWVPPRGFNQSLMFADGSNAVPSWAAALASPLLAIKLPNAKGNLIASSVQASLTDIPDTISDALNLGINFGGRSLQSISPGEQRERNFYFYYYQRDAMEADYASPIQEFSIKGSHYNSPWQPKRIFFPPNYSGK